MESIDTLKEKIREENLYQTNDISAIFEWRGIFLRYMETVSTLRVEINQECDMMKFRYDKARRSEYNAKRDEGVPMDRAELYKTLHGAHFYTEHVYLKSINERLREVIDWLKRNESMMNSMGAYIKQELEKEQFINKNN